MPVSREEELRQAKALSRADELRQAYDAAYSTAIKEQDELIKKHLTLSYQDIQMRRHSVETMFSNAKKIRNQLIRHCKISDLDVGNFIKEKENE
jgi:hypothetical protein